MKKYIHLITQISCVYFTACEIVVPESDDSSPTTEVDETTTTSGSTLRESIISEAKEHLGFMYYYGGSSPDTGFDCSGLIKYCYSENDIDSLLRSSRDMYSGGESIALKDAKIADITAFYVPVSHVAMLVSADEFIHSPQAGRSVCIESLNGYWTENLTGVVSYIDD